MIEGNRAPRLNLDALRARLREVAASTAVEQSHPVATQTRRTQVVPSVRDVLGGSDEAGCHRLTSRYEAAHRHAGIPLEALLACDSATFAFVTRDAALSNFDFRRTLFIDTETNGLAGGTGTYAFLVGVAYWEDNHFLVEQFFMPHPQQEPDLLAALASLLDRFDTFVSFNGKSFDLPILETRYILARQPRSLRVRPHLDLLHPARRLWKLRLESCSLGSLERRVLGTTRDEADVPGYLIPHLYNTFLRDHDPRPLQGIFYHNHQDLLSLAALAVHIAQVCTNPERHVVPHGQDLFSLARLFEDNKQWDQAEYCYRRALTTPLPGGVRAECVRRLSFLLKRLERWDEATELWRSMIGRGELYPYVELAKYHEHVRRYPPAAEQATLAAFADARAGKLCLSESERAELRYRLARLRRKSARPGERG